MSSSEEELPYNQQLRIERYANLLDDLFTGMLLKKMISFPGNYLLSKAHYKKIRYVHENIRNLYSELFDANIPKADLRFGAGRGHSFYNYFDDFIRMGHSFSTSKLTLEHMQISMLAEEEAHRYHSHVNKHFFINSDIDEIKNPKQFSFCWSMVTEGVAWHAKTEFVKKMNLEQLHKLLEFGRRMRHSYDKSAGLGEMKSISPNDVFAFLGDKDNKYFKDFVRLDPFAALSVVYPESEVDFRNCKVGAAYMYPDNLYFNPLT